MAAHGVFSLLYNEVNLCASSDLFLILVDFLLLKCSPDYLELPLSIDSIVNFEMDKMLKHQA